MSSPVTHYLSSTSRGFLVGCHLPFIPDFLADHTLLGDQPAQRIEEFTKRWVQFVSGLWRTLSSGHPGVSYCLHFEQHSPSNGIRALFLCRLDIEESGTGELQAQSLLGDIMARLQSFGFECEALDSEHLRRFVENEDHPYFCEVCQQEVMTPIRPNTPVVGEISASSKEAEFAIPREFVFAGGQTLYGVRPWWGTSGSFLLPFNAIASLEVPVSVSILLVPTELGQNEQKLMAEIARQTESLAQLQTKVMNVQDLPTDPSQNKTDPQLRWESRITAANLRRLNHPFLCSVFCSSTDSLAVQRLANTIASSIREEEGYDPPVGESEPMAAGAQVIYYQDYRRHDYIGKVVRNLDFQAFIELDVHYEGRLEQAPNQSLRRLRYLMDSRGAACAFRFPISVEGGVPGIPVKQRPPDFHPGPRVEAAPAGTIDLGKYHVGGRAFVNVKAFSKHALITGYTGSGKSNTSLYLLDQFWRNYKIPFLVVESAKKEYRGLRNVDVFQGSLRIYTLGNETLAPLRFNPFELIPGVRLELHLAHLQACFEGALPPVGPLPSVIAEALERVYQRFGWQLTDFGRERDQEPRKFPTMLDFYDTVEKVVASRGYQGEVRSNVEAAIKGRIKPLLMGSKGKMYSQRLSSPTATELFQNPVVLELNDLNEDDKSLMMMFILTLLREYRELHPSPDLCHVTLVEEAHNVLSNVGHDGGGEEKADVKVKSIQSFCNMLAEIRAYGEGLIIADQSPEKLARDAMRNTNVQISHQLRDTHDREAIANAMVMTDDQRDYLGKCETGRAAVFFTGLQKATFIDVPVYKDPEPARVTAGQVEYRYRGFSDSLEPVHSDSSVREYMRQYLVEETEERSCKSCVNVCEQRDRIFYLAEEGADKFKSALDAFFNAPNNAKGEVLVKLAGVVLNIAGASSEEDFDFSWCFVREMWMRHQGNMMRESDRDLFEGSFRSAILENSLQ